MEIEKKDLSDDAVWEQHIEELAQKQVENEMSAESNAIMSVVGAIMLAFSGLHAFGILLGLLGAFLIFWNVKNFRVYPEWRRVLGMIISGIIVIAAIAMR